MPATQLNANSLLLTHINLAFWDMMKKKKKEKKGGGKIPPHPGWLSVFHYFTELFSENHRK